MSAWWCTRGGLVTVVEAGFADDARTLAARAFGHQRTRDKDPEKVTARLASSADLALWAVLIGHQQAGVDGARVAELDEATVDEPGLFDLDPKETDHG